MNENIPIALQKLYGCVSKGLGIAVIPKDVRDILGRQVAQIEMFNDKKGIIEYFTSRDPERNAVPLHWFFFANHRFAFGIH